MNFDDYKRTINSVASCKPVEGWDFARMITLLEDVVLKLDHVEKQVDDAVDRITEALDE